MLQHEVNLLKGLKTNFQAKNGFQTIGSKVTQQPTWLQLSNQVACYAKLASAPSTRPQRVTLYNIVLQPYAGVHTCQDIAIDVYSYPVQELFSKNERWVFSLSGRISHTVRMDRILGQYRTDNLLSRFRHTRSKSH